MLGKQQLIRHRLLLRGAGGNAGFIAGAPLGKNRSFTQNSPVIEPIMWLFRRAGGDADAAVDRDAGCGGPSCGAARLGARCPNSNLTLTLILTLTLT